MGLQARFGWIDRNGQIVLLARSVRSFGQGFLAVLLGIHLAGRGVSLPGLGLVLSAGVLGGACFSAALTYQVDRFGRRRTLVALTLWSALWSAGLLVHDDLRWLMGCAFLASLSGVAGATGSGPAQPLEQAIVAGASAPERRAGLFALYRFIAIGAAAFGGLAAGLPTWLAAFSAIDPAATERAMILGFAACLVIVALLYAALDASVEIEATSDAAPRTNPLRTPSRRIILGLNGLFAVDQLGSSFTTTSLMAYWFHLRFGFDLASLATLSFAAQLLGALSMWLAVRLAARVGFVRTMVYSHVPASLMLIALAFVPSASWAVALWLGRGLLSQMDNPARDALTMSIVAPEERVAMASVHQVARNTVGTLGPTLATALWQGFSAAAPVVAGGVLKLGYDIALYAVYRDVREHPDR